MLNRIKWYCRLFVLGSRLKSYEDLQEATNHLWKGFHNAMPVDEAKLVYAEAYAKYKAKYDSDREAASRLNIAKEDLLADRSLEADFKLP